MIAIRLAPSAPRPPRNGSPEKKRKAPSMSDEWRTPGDLYGALSATYGPFSLDAAASASNHLVPRYFTKADDALRQSWRSVAGGEPGRVWLNPPYSRGHLDVFMGKARTEVLEGVELICCLVPHYTAEGWWHRRVEAPAGELLSTTAATTLLGPCTRIEWQHLTLDVLRLRGRLRHLEESGVTGPARFSSVVVVFSRPRLLSPLVCPRRRGPASCVSFEMERAIRRHIESGGSIAQACTAAGIARKTWYRHLERLAKRRLAGPRPLALQVTQQPDTGALQ